jgi:dipeptidyl-peptidase-3
LHVERSIATLTPQQLQYATYLALASWAGLPIILGQTSRESPRIHDFLSSLILQFPRAELEAAVHEPGTNLFYLLEYASVFYDNSGNYTGYDDTKFIPRVARDDLVALVASYPDLTAKLLSVIDDIYSREPGQLRLGWPPIGTSAYYEPRDFTADENQAIAGLLKSAKIHENNTIVYRLADRYEVKQMSIAVDDVGTRIGEVNGLPVFVTKGLHSETLKKVTKWLALARDFALNPTEADALTALIKHWETGNIEDHIRYSELWVGDSDPTVEFYHGVVESYRDPSGVRCEYESLVAAVDPKESRFLHQFVAESAKILPLLPYPPSYERKTFVAPTYNAINVLTFCCSGMPIGINLPNYEEVQHKKGSKNVSLLNVMATMSITPDTFPFLPDDRIPDLVEFYGGITTLLTAEHELYGHGSGAQLRREDVADGKVPDLLHPHRSVATYWEDGETYASVFGGPGSSLEECRAETTSLHLTYKDEVLEMYGVPADRRKAFKIAATLDMVHSGLKGIICYKPESSEWTQPHARARMAILRALLIWGRGGLSLKKVDGRYKLLIDDNKFDGIVDAIETLLKHLNYYRSVKLPCQAKEFIGALTSVDGFWLDVRAQVEQFRRPTRVDCAAVVKRTESGYTLARSGGEKLTVLDVAVAAVETHALANE